MPSAVFPTTIMADLGCIILQRGMTLAPRVEVYTQLACRAIHGNDPVNPNATSLYFSPSYEYDGYNTTKTHDEDYDYDYTTISLPSRGIVDMEALDACKGDPRVQGRAARIQACTSTFLPHSPVQSICWEYGLSWSLCGLIWAHMSSG